MMAAFTGAIRARRSGSFLLAALSLAAGLAACGEELPTEAGGPLIPADAVRTFQVILDPAVFLVTDTAFSGFDDPFGAGFFLIANDFQGTLDARTLARFTIPTLIAAPDSNGTVRNDSTPHYIGGRVVLQLDTLRSEVDRPFEVQLHLVTEEWEPLTATWQLRVDTAGEQLPWSQPGAGGGSLVSSATWPQGLDSLNVPFDSLVIDVDSQTIAAWADTTTPGRGAVISLATAGGRVRASDVVLRIDARPTFRPDTVVTVTDRPSNTTFLFDPPLGSSSAQLLVGGRPSWRSYLLFRQGLDTLSVPCPQISAECTIRLADASITFSALQLTPVASPAGYLPQDSMRLTSAFLLASSVAPLERSPLGNGVGVSADFITPSRFEPPAGGSPVEVPVTTFVRSLVGDTVAIEDDEANVTTRWLALLPLLEGIDFGMAAFAPGPKLRIVLTVARELQLR